MQEEAYQGKYLVLVKSGDLGKYELDALLYDSVEEIVESYGTVSGTLLVARVERVVQISEEEAILKCKEEFSESPGRRSIRTILESIEESVKSGG